MSTTSLPTFGLSEVHRELRSVARDVAEREIAPHASRIDAESAFPRESLEALIRADLHAVGIPEEYGGQGGGHLASAVVAEQIARSCATTQQVAGANELFALPLLLFGSEELKQRYLPEVARGRALGAFALSEAEAGSDISAIKTTAELVGDMWHLRGSKRWITNAGVADFYVVFAATDPDGRSRRLSAFVIERDDPGLTFGVPERKMGLRGSPTCEVYLDGVVIPSSRLIGELGAGMRVALATLERTRTTVAAQAVGIAQGALDVALEYVVERKQFGRPISDFQGVQFMLADMEMKVRAARLLAYAAAAEAEHSSHDMALSGAAAKCFASDAAMAVTVDAVQLLGGAGYVADFPVERMMRDAKITQIYEGTNQVQRIVIARQILNGASP